VGETVDKRPSALDVRHRMRRRKQLEQDLDHITQEMYRRNRELADTNRTLSLLQAIDTLALEPQTSLGAICEQITEAIVQTTDYPFAAVLTSTSDSLGSLELRGWKAKDPTLSDNLVKLGLTTATRLRIGKTHLNTGPYTELLPLANIKAADIKRVLGCSMELAHLVKTQTAVQSLYVGKLIARDRLVGLLVAGMYLDAKEVSPQETLLLERLREPVGVALDNRLLFEENKRVLAQVRHSNAKLKALDETKDDFISMASHQLRTPLTSVKGYLSMVLEGDAGSLNDSQRKLLEQSYRSSQQMVYLISDLLNLSRLNTGKFIIDPSVVDLSEIVQAEVDQLTETAKARGLTLTYDKPSSFPKLFLDETKTHQVIMNFIDNAIYYTPTGGTVTVALRETPTAVEYTVNDTGIGVPKDVQHKLFAKFYRAQNAQKARPDGTGLGLFMAKKVVVAQDGAIIFNSKEGKGSTFGFRFSKAGHMPPANN